MGVIVEEDARRGRVVVSVWTSVVVFTNVSGRPTTSFGTAGSGSAASAG